MARGMIPAEPRDYPDPPPGNDQTGGRNNP
jgi:hypothetical protein